MRRAILAATVGAALAGGAHAAPAPAPQPGIEARLERLERVLESRTLVDMMTRLDRQQEEIQRLRGQVEEQAHVIETLRERQRELYLDTDRRLLRLEREAPAGGGPAPVLSSGGTPASEPDAAGPSPEALAEERKAYQAAFDLLKDLRYDQAVRAFGDFVQKHPQSRYAHIAQYWLGEAHYQQRDFKQAIAAYQGLLENHPNSPKLAEALLKIGYSRFESGDRPGAKAVLADLLERYPDTTEAGQASALLKQIGG